MTSTELSAPVSPVDALLALQAHDATLHELETRAAAVAARRSALSAEREALAAQAGQARAGADAEQKRHRGIALRLAAARVELDQRVAAQQAAERLAEVTAAFARVEEARRAVVLLEAESAASRKRTTEQAARAQHVETRAAAAAAADRAAQDALAEEAKALDTALAPARTLRATLAGRVAPDVLVAYDRVRRRRPTQAVVALRGAACSACDTAMPVQRQRLMAAQGRIEVCEGCGVLLYVAA